MQNLIRLSQLRNVKSGQLVTALKEYKGTPFKDVNQDILPPGFKIYETPEGKSIRKELQFKEFKQAWRYFNFWVVGLAQYGCYPSAFNVYNRIIFDLYTEQAEKRQITTKDLFLSYLLNQMISGNGQAAEEQAIEKFKNI